MKTTHELVELFRQGTEHLSNMANNLDFPWSITDERDPRRIHNIYVRSLITCYVSKYAQLSHAILEAIENNQFLIYALAGRSLIEITATLRYYVIYKYLPLFEKGSLDNSEMKQLLEIDDRHLRGGRFSWEMFFLKEYEKLKEETVKQLKSKKEKQKHIADGIIAEQVNVLTCVEKWADECPEILLGYNLYCDLVHPNIGSAFLVASTNERGLYFSPSKGTPVGKAVFEQSFPILVSITHKQFGDHLLRLMGTIWADDEFDPPVIH